MADTLIGLGVFTIGTIAFVALIYLWGLPWWLVIRRWDTTMRDSDFETIALSGILGMFVTALFGLLLWAAHDVGGKLLEHQRRDSHPIKAEAEP